MKIKHLVLAGFAAALLASPPACAQGVPVLLERGVPVLLERALVEFGFIARGARLATPMVTRSASDLYGIRMTSEISNLGKVSEFSSYRTLSERLGRTSILDSSDTLAPSINKFDPRLFKILQNPDLFENAAAKAATPAAPAPSMATELASLGAAKDVAKEMASPSADIGSDPLFHFSVLSGKLEMGSVANYKYLGIKGGEINIYRWGAAGAGAIYCESRECVAELMKKAAEADELFHPKKQEKAPTNLPEKVDLPN